MDDTAQRFPDDSTVSGQQGQDDGVGQGQVPSVPVPQPAQPVGRVGKEEEPSFAKASEGEYGSVEEVGEGEIDPEVQEFITREKKEFLELDRSVVHGGETVVEAAGGSDMPQVVLPMSRSSLAGGVKNKVTTSARWLAEWCLRVIKKLHGRVVYAQDERSREVEK